MRQYTGTFPIGMKAVWKKDRVGIQSLMEVNKFYIGHTGNCFNSQLNFPMPVTCTGFKSGMPV